MSSCRFFAGGYHGQGEIKDILHVIRRVESYDERRLGDSSEG